MPDLRVSINKNGKLMLPDDADLRFLLTVPRDVKVTVNDKNIDNMVSAIEVTAKDEIMLSIQKENIPKEIMVRISPDKMYAYIKLKPAVEYYLEVQVENDILGRKDNKSNNKKNNAENTNKKDDAINIINKIIFIEVLLKSKTIYDFNMEKLKEALENAGVIYGIDEAALESLLYNAHNKEVLVAKGTPPKPGKDEQVNILVNTEPIFQLKRTSDNRVDFKKIRTIMTVMPGDIIAVKIPGQSGIAGVNVLGETIEPPDYKRITLEAGEGTELRDDGFSVVASIRGLPSVKIKKLYLFEVRRVFITDEVNMRTGNLEFDGDIVVQKDVKEGMSVFATGNIVIEGSVFNAKITALGNVYIGKNVIHSFINAGVGSDYMRLLKEKLNYIADCLQKISQYVSAAVVRFEQIYPEQVIPVGKIVINIINVKFKDLVKTVDTINKTLRKKECIVSSSVEDVINELDMRFRRLGWLKTKNSEEVKKLYKKVVEAIKSLDANIKEGAGDVVFSYAFSSTVETSGNVHVAGRGCVSTDINAKGDVTVDAVFRAGTINCQGNVKVNEAGSEIGAKTVIKSNGSYVQIEKAYPNLTITLGGAVKRVSDVEYKIFMRNEEESTNSSG